MNNFASQYGKDFNDLNADAICNWYQFPLSVLTPQGSSVFETKKDFLISVEKLLKTYRSFNFSHAEVLTESVTLRENGLNQNDVVWRLIDDNGELIIDFEITYFFKEHEAEIRLCGVISHNEFSEWHKKLEATKG